ncbi:MAG TPA: glycosyltransferase family 25 protein [Pyrinomonadaceae bacterium]|nr:glycosyltransferase family 25 protein [Pyrinomonadaceae bacterium]
MRFPHQVCINLDRRPDRWRQMQHKFAEQGINSVQRFPAVDGSNVTRPPTWAHTPGAYGCLLSHVQVVREAQALGVSSVLVFEDDVVFADQLEQKFSLCIDQVPSNWDILYLGAIHKEEPIKVTDSIARITNAYSTYAYVLRDTVFESFIALNTKTGAELDNNSFILQQQFNCYCFLPHLAWVETDYSDAQERLVNHWYLRESLVPFGSEVDRMLGQTTILFAHHGAAGPLARENLIFLVEYYNRFFYSPYISIVIVEQGPEQTINSHLLPRNCKHVFQQQNDKFDRERCFQIGFAHADPDSKFFIISESDLFLETLDIRANLRMCERYDRVTGFAKSFDLTSDDSARIRNTKSARGVNLMKDYAPHSEGASNCRFLRREVIEAAIDHQQNGNGVSLLSGSQNGWRIFQSPNHALRLR